MSIYKDAGYPACSKLTWTSLRVITPFFSAVCNRVFSCWTTDHWIAFYIPSIQFLYPLFQINSERLASSHHTKMGLTFTLNVKPVVYRNERGKGTNQSQVIVLLYKIRNNPDECVLKTLTWKLWKTQNIISADFPTRSNENGYGTNNVPTALCFFIEQEKSFICRFPQTYIDGWQTTGSVTSKDRTQETDHARHSSVQLVSLFTANPSPYQTTPLGSRDRDPCRT